MSKKQIRTIADIAELAGVAKSTVSRALADSPLISEQTKARIRAIAEANEYEIHHGARHLSLQRSQTIGVVIPINPKIGRFVTDPFNLELLGALANALTTYEYDLLVVQIQQDDHRAITRHITSKRTDGLILFGCDLQAEEISTLMKHKASFVLWGPTPAQQSHCSVGSDDVQGGYLATHHLISLGRTRIGFIGGMHGAGESRQRYRGYQQAMQEAQLPIEPQRLADGDYTSVSGFSAMEQLLTQDPTLDAVFVSSDVMAIAAMEALRKHGRTVPDDVAVVGFDGLPLSAYCSPPLTTIQQNITQAGQVLVKTLLQYLDGGIISNVILPVELIVRQSTLTS